VISVYPKSRRILSRLLRFRKPDLWMLFDVFNCPDHKKHFSDSFLKKIVSRENYILGQNAYGDICYLNALPCNGNIGDGTNCVEKKEDYFGVRGNNSGWRNGYCPVNDNKELFTKAVFNIFLSPLHASVFQKIYPGLKEKTFILKPLVDVDLFRDKGIKRDIKYASYGGHSETKGFYNIMEMFPNEEVIFFGSKNDKLPRKFGYGKVIGRIPYDEMPEFLNRVEYYIHMPRWPEPHGLIVNQAALSGCKLITNDNVGAMTHSYDMMDREAYRKNAEELWEKIEDTVKQKRCVKP